jgi:hypothetical protein
MLVLLGPLKSTYFLASTLEENKVADPHHVKADPDPACYFNADLGIQLFTLS